MIGGSGAGKSVLLKCLIGLLRPGRGTHLLRGQDVTALRRGGLPSGAPPRGHGVPGRGALRLAHRWGRTWRIRCASTSRRCRDEEVRDRVAEKLELVNLPGIEGMRPADLSGGMRKRVGLARAIATDPEVILWDEPTTGLDPISTRTIDELINSMKQKLGCTSIVVTHDMESAFACPTGSPCWPTAASSRWARSHEMRRSTLPEVRAFLDAAQGLRPRMELNAWPPDHHPARAAPGRARGALRGASAWSCRRRGLLHRQGAPPLRAAGHATAPTSRTWRA